MAFRNGKDEDIKVLPEREKAKWGLFAQQQQKRFVVKLRNRREVCNDARGLRLQQKSSDRPYVGCLLHPPVSLETGEMQTLLCDISSS